MNIAYNTARTTVTISMPGYVAEDAYSFSALVPRRSPSPGPNAWAVHRSNLRPEITAAHIRRRVPASTFSVRHRTPGHHWQSPLLRARRGLVISPHCQRTFIKTSAIHYRRHERRQPRPQLLHSHTQHGDYVLCMRYDFNRLRSNVSRSNACCVVVTTWMSPICHDRTRAASSTASSSWATSISPRASTELYLQFSIIIPCVVASASEGE
jgi:hypothetical protein